MFGVYTLSETGLIKELKPEHTMRNYKSPNTKTNI